MPTRVLKRARIAAPAIETRALRAIGDRMLSELGLDGAELSVLVTHDREIHALNREHRGKDRPTDVLAFPLDDPPASSERGPRLLGDVVISLETAERQARSRRRPLVHEVRFLLAHGILHLIGYDHAEPEEKREMVTMTRRLVRACPLPGDRKPAGRRISGRKAARPQRAR